MELSFKLKTPFMETPLSFLVQFAHSRSTRPSSVRRANETENRRTFYLNSGGGGGGARALLLLLHDVGALPTNERARMLLESRAVLD